MNEVACFQVMAVFSSEDEARSMARGLVEARLAACAQVAGPIASIYWWQGELDEAREWVCIAKTAARLYPRVEDFIRRRHSYSVPEILATPVAAGSRDYLDWINSEVVPEEES